MFDKNKFALILKNISDTYDNQREFSEKSDINRTYLSQYMNMKLENPPKPEILQRLADASNNVTNYSELMNICGYNDENNDIVDIDLLLSNTSHYFPEDLLKKIQYDKLSPSSKIVLQNMLRAFRNKVVHGTKEHISIDFYREQIASKDEWNTIFGIYILYMKYLYKTLSLIGNKEIQNFKNSTGISFTDNNDNLSKQFYMCPVYGKISAGIPNWAEECLEGYLPIDPNMFGIVNPEECFFLKVDGESMNKEIRNGAYALIRKQDIVENGEICAVLVNGFEATLKKFSKQGDLVILEPMSNDPSFTTQVYNKDTQIKILGKYIGKFEINK